MQQIISNESNIPLVVPDSTASLTREESNLEAFSNLEARSEEPRIQFRRPYTGPFMGLSLRLLKLLDAVARFQHIPEQLQGWNKWKPVRVEGGTAFY